MLNEISPLGHHLPFNVFGSEDSLDFDVMLKVDEMPILAVCKSFCESYDRSMTRVIETNSNLCVVKDGIVVDVFKGTVDEVNNMLFYTYDRHPQLHPCFVTRPVIRDIPTKANRALRGLLSHLSKTSYREVVKTGLRGSMADRIEALRKIDFNQISELDKNNSKLVDYYKTLAFQVGQTTGLINDGAEYYSKGSIAAHFPHLRELLYRESFDTGILNYIVDEFLDTIEAHIDNRENIYEVLKK